MSDCKHVGEEFEHDNYEEGACSQCGMYEAEIAWAKVAEQAAEIKRLKVIEEAAKNVTGYPSPIALAELCEALELDDE